MKRTLVLILAAIPTGIAVGAVDALFGRVLLYLGAVRDAHVMWLVPFLGLVGAAFTFLLKRCKKEAQTGLKDPILRIFVMGIALSTVLLALWKGRYCGLGTNLINAGLAGGKVYAWDWAAKLVLTVLTLSAGYQGGEVTPLFSMGASLGAAVSGLLDLPAAFCAGLGYAAVFGSATNTLIAPALITAEVFGWPCAPYALITCALAYAVNGNRSIYAGQRLSR